MKKRKIIILGSGGMLGQVAERYFLETGNDVQSFDDRFTRNNRVAYSKKLLRFNDAIVINCIGKIRQKTSDANDLLFANAILPSELRNCLQENVTLIQPSTDCVFNGDMGEPYHTNHLADATDDYGWSKRLGEVVLYGRPNTFVIRVSIIGPDRNPEGKGLMAWVKSQSPGTSINGFTNHLWNGITTLEWCKQLAAFLDENREFDFRLVQYGTREFYSKHEMLLLINEVYKLGLKIEPKETEVSVDRRLVPDVVCESLIQQLEELKAFENV